MSELELSQIYDTATGLPRRNELLRFPRWALVACAGHAARLSLAFLEEVLPELDDARRETLFLAVRSAEKLTSPRALKDHVVAVERVFNSVNALLATDPNRATRAFHLVDSVFYAVHAAYVAANNDDSQVAEDSQLAAENAVRLQPRLLPTLRDSFRSIQAASDKMKWDDESLGPLAFFQSRGRDGAYFGRVMTLAALVTLRQWPVSDEFECLVSSSTQSLPSDVVFISHAWLSPDHPDPGSTKLAIIKRHVASLRELQTAVSSIDPSSLTRGDQAELARRRCEIPLILRGPGHDDVFLKGGWKWSTDGDDAAVQFRSSLQHSIDATLNASVWIDSFACPHPRHRAACPMCDSVFRSILTRIPEIISHSTCVVLSGLADNEQERGWMILESCAAYHHHRRVQVDGQWDMDALTSRLDHIDFSCSSFEDGRMLSLIWALTRCRSFLQVQNQVHSVVSAPTDVECVMSMLHRPLGLEIDFANNIENTHWQLKELFSLVYSKKFLDECRNHGRNLAFWSGGIAINLATYCATGVLLAACWQKRIKIESSEWHPMTLVQACIYEFVCRHRQCPDVAAVSVIRHWGKAFCIDTVAHFAIGQHPEHDVHWRALREWHLHWENGGTIDVGIDEFSFVA